MSAKWAENRKIKSSFTLCNDLTRQALLGCKNLQSGLERNVFGSKKKKKTTKKTQKKPNPRPNHSALSHLLTANNLTCRPKTKHYTDVVLNL